jgi:hypothetical protein
MRRTSGTRNGRRGSINVAANSHRHGLAGAADDPTFVLPWADSDIARVAYAYIIGASNTDPVGLALKTPL